ncbi:topoisomerase family protein Trf4 [Penicillium citrinum]|uniref:polynucleotide adenylyltransferase n=2 Tax=Penicillium TaxID=5073 RepID=A0A9W9PDJ8_PENCI|nr:topoisomerase family protein Trf4 [Penicillium citrinum]KAJ5242431.1 topoisomerase family protein Trf4 [Penicillium citrinum]KAJ5600067.1 topoisomerase family protein Trf4 [Penicillium hetheringtonii]
MAPFRFQGNDAPKGRGNGRDRRSRPKHEFTFRFPHTSERPLLSQKRETTPELLTADGAEKAGPKFAPINSLSDSEEAEMDLSDSSEDESRPRKRRAIASDDKKADAAFAPAPAPTPKWSNPDPYTVLPPPDESQNKKIDVVKLIRKARIEANNASKPEESVAENHDFISLDAPPEEDEKQRESPPVNAPKGPKSMASQNQTQPQESAVLQKKRTRDDEPKGFSTKVGKPISRFNKDGSILHSWKALSPQSGTPWTDGIDALHMGTRLHQEVLSFYNWIKPHDFEHLVRQDLIQRLEVEFKKRYGGVELHAFGSFASGLYLPIADVDLVLMSRDFLRSGRRSFGERPGQIYAFSAFIKGLGVAVPGSIESIAHARVPIIKFVDKQTGLRVDLSFDNDSGLLANETFRKWKEQYPAMPVIVSVIKQFLLIRGLNEVPTGGLGGFSITCLVASLLMHMPRRKEMNLGKILLNFFDFYGNVFRFEETGIRMNPPQFFNKVFGSRDRLMIEDPNNPDNDISGGTKEIALVFRTFSQAFSTLSRRMLQLADSPDSGASILGSIIAANYEEYMIQRYQLREVFESSNRFAIYRNPPPPPPHSSPPHSAHHLPPLPPGPPPPISAI